MINIKNHFIIFALIIMFLIIQSVFAITTPRGSQVSDTCNPSEYDDPDYIAYLNNYYDEAYPNATRLGDASNTYNCHGYAWHMSEGGGTIMIGCNSSTAEDIYWTDGSYDEMPSVAYATKVRYSGNHSAITTSGGNYISKWGGGPLYRHAPNYCPGSYGSSYKYYVRSVDVPQDYSSIADASDEAVIGQTIIVTSGTHTESNSSTINSGVTLQLNPGVTLRMANGKKLTINGTLSAQGTYNNRITFQSSSGTWYGIELNYCSSTTL